MVVSYDSVSSPSPRGNGEEDESCQTSLPHHRHPSYLSAGSGSRYSGWTPFILAGLGITVAILISFTPTLHQRSSLNSRLSAVPLLGKSNKSSKKNDVLSEKYDCESDPSYSKHTLKRAYDLPYAALFRDNRGQSKFEASDVTIVGNNVYSVCDSSWAISKFTRDLSPFPRRTYKLDIQIVLIPRRIRDTRRFSSMMDSSMW